MSGGEVGGCRCFVHVDVCTGCTSLDAGCGKALGRRPVVARARGGAFLGEAWCGCLRVEGFRGGCLQYSL